MNRKRTIDISKPLRPDESYLKDLISGVINSRIAVITLSVVILALLVIVFFLSTQSKLVAIINKNSGETYVAKTSKITQDVLERQIVYYSKKLCEDYLNLDYMTVVESRKRALELMHPSMKEELGAEKYWQTKKVLTAMKEKYSCDYKWLMYPKITERSHPHYIVFCQFMRVIRKKGYKPMEETFTIRLDWVRLLKNPSPFERPHDLLLTRVWEIQKDSDEMKNQLKLYYKS